MGAKERILRIKLAAQQKRIEGLVTRVQQEIARKSGQWEEDKHPRADDGKFGSGGGGKETAENQRDSKPERTKIGSGNTGDVYREGNEAVKSAVRPDGTKTREGEFYQQLSGIDGIAPGRQVDDEIRTPFYQEVLSVDTVKDDDIRQSMGDVLAPNLTRILNAANGMSEAGIDYNDPLQVGFDDDYKAHVFDLSNAGRAEPSEALRANIANTVKYLEDFGLPRAAGNISRTFGIYNQARLLSGSKPDSVVQRINSLAAKGNPLGLHLQSMGAVKITGYDVKHAYYAHNPRHVNVRGVLQSEPDTDGLKVILSDKPIDADMIRQYGLIPVVHPAKRFTNGD